MLSWLKSSSKQGIQNKVGLKAPLVELLEKDFEKLDAKQPDISKALLKYAVDGDGEGALRQLRAMKGAGSALGLNCCPLGLQISRVANFLAAPTPGISGGSIEPDATRVDFFSRLDQDVPELLLRLAFIYEAASQTERRQLQASWLGSDLAWLEVFLTEATVVHKPGSPRHIRFNPHITAATVEAMFVANQQSADSLVGAAFRCEGRFSRYYSPPPMFISLPGFGDYVARHAERLDEILTNSDPDVRSYALKALEQSRISVAPFISRIAQLATGSSKRVREGASRLLPAEPAAALEAARAIARTGSTDERAHAVRLVSKLAHENAVSMLKELLDDEKSTKVRDEIQSILVVPSIGNDGTKAASASSIEVLLPPVVSADLDTAVDEGFLVKLEIFAREYNAWQAAQSAKHSYFRGDRDLTPQDVRYVFDFLKEKSGNPTRNLGVSVYGGNEALFKLLGQQELGLTQAVKLLMAFGHIAPERGDRYAFGGYWTEQALEHYFTARGRPADLREIAAAFTATGLDHRLIGTNILDSTSWYSSSLFEVPPENLWPYFAEHPEFLEEALGMRHGPYGEFYRLYERETPGNAMRILAMMPSIPPAFHARLWELALGTLKVHRSPAQKCVEKIPGFEGRLILTLTSGQQETRVIAAEWVGRVRPAGATAALVKALKKEKSDAAKAAMMQALEALGASIDDFMNRVGLEKESEKELARGVPDHLQWFPFKSMPAVKWADTGDPVSPQILTWFIVKSFKLKNPEPDPLLRRYCSLFSRPERQALGKMVLESWLAHDTRGMDPDEAARKAREYVARNSHFYQFSQSMLYQDALSRFMREGSCSAINEKGILAVAAACAGAEAAHRVSPYLKQWYGYRAAQCKALLQMVAWVDDPAAVQLVLSVGNRFRTKGIREEAARQISLMADRKNWTIDELADRTIPTAGFDDEGVFEIDYGARKFYARLGEEFKIILTSEDGKEIKSLPDANKTDDESTVKAAKTAFGVVRKELKSTLKLQAERLYEAMCVRRTWTFSDWDTYLNRHPIVGRYCQSLVWGEYDSDLLVRTFRPLPDRSLTDSGDDSVTIGPDVTIRVAHGCDLAEQESRAWADHFADYKVSALFAQFGRQVYTLPDALKDETGITEFQGFLIEAFKLRGHATRLGYTRGPTGDGGWFYEYVKHFVTLGLQSVIEFSGNGLPEENRTVALMRLYFVTSGAPGQVRPGRPIRLHQVPPVLLSECWNDMRSIAGNGTGQDPDWEKKVQP